MARHLTLGLTGYFLRQERTRKRWLVFGSVLLLFSIIMTQLLRMMAPPGTLNVWDGLFSITASYQTNLFILCLFFIVSVLDNLYGYDEQNIFLRISNKLRWYESKVLVLFVQIAGLTFVFYAIPAFVSFVQFPSQSGWSAQWQLVFEGRSSAPVYFVPYADFAPLFPPRQAFVMSVMLTILSLMAMGLFNLLLYLWLGRAKLLVIAINVLYLVLNYVVYHYGAFGGLKYGMIYDYMILSYYFYIPGQPDLLGSMGLLVLLIIGFLVGGRVSLRHWSVQ